MLNKWLILGLIAVVLVAGCTQQYIPRSGGIVEHNNSLSEALSKCKVICDCMYCQTCSFSDERCKHFGDPIPLVKECTEKECMCIC